MRPSRWRLDRRTVLRGAGGVALALPWLEAMVSPRRAGAADPPPKRFVAWFQPGGCVADKWWPTGGETSFTLGPSLAPLNPHKADLLVLRGIDYKAAGRSAGHPHYAGLASFLTGHVLPQGTFTVPDGGAGEPTGWAQGPSIDQVIASKIGVGTKFRSLELTVRHDGPRPANPVRIMSYEAANKPITPVVDPVEAWERLFKDQSGGADPALERRRRRGRSVLDALREEYRVVGQRVGTADRAKLEQHASRIREIETSLDAITQPAPSSGQRCSGGTPVAKIGFSSPNVPAVGAAFMDIMVMALSCDLTRVASLMWVDPLTRNSFGSIGLPGNHHYYQHDGGYRPAELARIETWYAEQLAAFITKVKAVKEGDGTLLDHLVLYAGSEISHASNHDHRSIPTILAGRGGGSLRPGRYLQFNGRAHNDLLVTLGNAFGLGLQSFGLPGLSTGPITNLA